MAFAALIPLITSALSAAQASNKSNESTGQANTTPMSLEPEKEDNSWSGFTLPTNNNPLASSYERAMQVWKNSQANSGGQNGY